MCHPDVTTDYGVVSDGDASQDAGIAVDCNVIFDDGMTRYVEHVALCVFLETLRTECHALIEGYVVTDNGCLTDDDTCAVVDGEIFANLCTRVDIDACLGVCQFGNDARYDGHVQSVELIGNAIVCHCTCYGIAEYDFSVVGCGGVVVEHGLYVGIEQTFDFRQCVDEL